MSSGSHSGLAIPLGLPGTISDDCRERIIMISEGILYPFSFRDQLGKQWETYLYLILGLCFKCLV